jgi:hypothetical protein
VDGLRPGPGTGCASGEPLLAARVKMVAWPWGACGRLRPGCWMTTATRSLTPELVHGPDEPAGVLTGHPDQGTPPSASRRNGLECMDAFNPIYHRPCPFSDTRSGTRRRFRASRRAGRAVRPPVRSRDGRVCRPLSRPIPAVPAGASFAFGRVSLPRGSLRDGREPARSDETAGLHRRTRDAAQDSGDGSGGSVRPSRPSHCGPSHDPLTRPEPSPFWGSDRTGQELNARRSAG